MLNFTLRSTHFSEVIQQHSSCFKEEKKVYLNVSKTETCAAFLFFLSLGMQSHHPFFSFFFFFNYGTSSVFTVGQTLISCTQCCWVVVSWRKLCFFKSCSLLCNGRWKKQSLFWVSTRSHRPQPQRFYWPPSSPPSLQDVCVVECVCLFQPAHDNPFARSLLVSMNTFTVVIASWKPTKLHFYSHMILQEQLPKKAFASAMQLIWCRKRIYQGGRRSCNFSLIILISFFNICPVLHFRP